MKSLRKLLTSYFLIIVFVFSGCQEKALLPIDEFYGFENLSILKIRKPAKVQYFLGIDKEPIPLEVTAYEINGKLVNVPAGAVNFTANGERVEGDSFIPQKAGLFRLAGKLAGKVSDTLQVQVWDPATLSIRLSQVNEQDQFLSNGADTVTFDVELMNGKEVIEGNFPITVEANETETDNPFSTIKAGEYKFVAKGLGLSSNQITVRFTAPEVYQVVRFPVIFHEVNNSRLTAARIRQYTDAMTNAYRNRKGEARMKDAKSTDLYVEFYPIETGLDGNTLAIPGLERVTSAKSNFTQEETAADAFNTFWDPKRVINVWVYPNIVGASSSFSWAYYPFVTKPIEGLPVVNQAIDPFFPYGIFLNAEHLNEGEDILSHEVGHMLGLAHVFAGGGVDFEGCPQVDPDYCRDTPYYDRAQYGSGLVNNPRLWFNRQSCSGSQYVATNFMDYYYSYNTSFTVEQAKRVRHTVDFGLWLPTAFNGARNGRFNNQIDKVKKPANWRYVKPVICATP